MIRALALAVFALLSVFSSYADTIGESICHPGDAWATYSPQQKGEFCAGYTNYWWSGYAEYCVEAGPPNANQNVLHPIVSCGPTECHAENDQGSSFLRFFTNAETPSTYIQDAGHLAGLSSAFYALGDVVSICKNGCVHEGIPMVSDPDGLYASQSPDGAGFYGWYRGYDFDRIATSCNANDEPYASQVVKTAAELTTPSGNTTTTGTGGGSSEPACVEGDTRASCSVFGSAGAADIPAQSFGLDYVAETLWGSGNCPADSYWQSNTVYRNFKIWDWQLTCGYLTQFIKPIVLLLGAYAAFMILLTGRPGNSDEGAAS